MKEDIGNILGVNRIVPIDPLLKVPAKADWREKNKAIKDYRHIRNGVNLNGKSKTPIRKSKFG